MQTTWPTGQELRDERTAAELTQAAVAAHMGVHRATIVANEARAQVRPSFARRYRDAITALATLREAV